MEEIVFSENRRKKYEKILNLDHEELELFIKRYTHYLKSQKILSKNSVLNGFFILADIRQQKDKTEALKAKYRSKNRYIIKYRDEIVELYKNGLGYVRISKQLEVNHKVKVSKSSIERFIKNNGITRDG
jgi:hypothetical protein